MTEWERHVAEVRQALDELRDLDEIGKIAWLLGVTVEDLERVGGLGPGGRPEKP